MSNTVMTHLPEVKGSYTVERKVHTDERGTFCELLRADDHRPKFKQQNQSFSFGGVLRGMHTQSKKPQGKLVTCLYGTVLDVIFDIRKGSPTYMQGLAKMLDFEAVNSLYVPPGCLHGFLALSKFAVVHYSCTEYYDPESDGGVNWESPKIRELFEVADIDPIVSLKDQALPSLDEYLKQME